MTSAKGLPCRKGMFCFLVNLVNYLAFYDILCSEEWLSGILGYTGFYFTTDRLPSREVVHGRSASLRELFGRLQLQLAQPLEDIRIVPGKKAMHSIRELLDCHQLLPVWIDDYYLDYSPYYRTAHYQSLVVLLEINASHVIFFDNDLKELPGDVFLAAVSGQKEIELYYTNKNRLDWDRDHRQLLSAGLKWSMDCLCSGVQSGTEFYGIDGMVHFAGAVQGCRDTEEINNFYFQLNRPGGLTITRENLCRLLKEMDAAWHFPGMQKGLEVYSLLSERWRKIGSLLFRLGCSGDEGLKERIVQRIYEAVEIEREGAEVLRRLALQLETEDGI